MNNTQFNLIALYFVLFWFLNSKLKKMHKFKVSNQTALGYCSTEIFSIAPQTIVQPAILVHLRSDIYYECVLNADINQINKLNYFNHLLHKISIILIKRRLQFCDIKPLMHILMMMHFSVMSALTHKFINVGFRNININKTVIYLTDTK